MPISVKAILNKYRTQLTLVIGNGINLYGAADKTNSWHDLLLELSKKHLPSELKYVPQGVSLTEFYDVLELKSTKNTLRLQQEFCDAMSSWQYYAHHQRIVNWARTTNNPILTTNFETTLEEAGSCSLRRTIKGGFTDFYPWENYYGSQEITDPSQEFAIWHINGMQHYYRSIRLGLSHYMGAVDRARVLISQSGRHGLYASKDISQWRGAHSWLHCVFHSPLLIFGLSLEENEIFLRWLLIERARYYKKYPQRKQKAWYVHRGEMANLGKKYFLEGVGVDPLSVADYDDIYSADIWN